MMTQEYYKRLEEIDRRTCEDIAYMERLAEGIMADITADWFLRLVGRIIKEER